MAQSSMGLGMTNYSPTSISCSQNGTIANTEDAFHEAKNWLEQKKLVWTDKTIREGIKRNRPDWPEA